MAFDVFLFLSALIVSLAWLCHLSALHHHLPHSRVRTIRTTMQRLLKPRTPLDGPACRPCSTLSSGVGTAASDVAPLARGQKPTESPEADEHPGLCLPPITSARPWASQTLTFMRLFGDGTPGPASRIQTCRGPACHTTFSARLHTPLYRLKPASRAGSPSC